MIVSDDRVARFVSGVLDYPLNPPWTCMGIERDGMIIAGVVFNCFEGCDVHLTIVGTGWTPEFIWAVGQYVFEQLNCERWTATTEFPEVANLAEKLGGQREGLLRNHFGMRRDAIIVGILREEWYSSKVISRIARLTASRASVEREACLENSESA